LKATSRPCEVGMLVLAKTPPSWVVVACVSRSLPEPCASVAVGQVANGLAVALPAADRQAVLIPVAGEVGSDTDPAEPSTVLSWNDWLNRTVPAASAFGACTITPTVTTLIIRVTAAARATIRRARGEKGICRLLFTAVRGPDRARKSHATSSGPAEIPSRQIPQSCLEPVPPDNFRPTKKLN